MGKLYMYCLIDKEVAVDGLAELARIRGTSNLTLTGCICNLKTIYCPNLEASRVASQEATSVPTSMRPVAQEQSALPVPPQINQAAADVVPKREIVEGHAADDANNVLEQQSFPAEQRGNAQPDVEQEYFAPSIGNSSEQYSPNFQVEGEEQQGPPQPEQWHENLAAATVESGRAQYYDRNWDQERRSRSSSWTESVSMHSNRYGWTAPYDYENTEMNADDQPGPSPPIQSTEYREMSEVDMRYVQPSAHTLDQYASNAITPENDESSMNVEEEEEVITHHESNSSFEQYSRSTSSLFSRTLSPIEETPRHMLEPTEEETTVHNVLNSNNPSDQQAVRQSERVLKRRLNENELNPTPKKEKRSLIGTSSTGVAKQDVRRKVGRPRKDEAKKNVGRPRKIQPEHQVGRNCTIRFPRAVGRARKIRVKRGRPAKNQQAGIAPMNQAVSRPHEIQPKRKVGRPTKKSQKRPVGRPRKIQETLGQPSEQPPKRPVGRQPKNQASNSSVSRNVEQITRK